MHDERRDEDDPQAFVGQTAEGEVHQGNQQQENEELPELDADVEGEQRGHEVGAGELERFAEGEREAEAVDEAETEAAAVQRRSWPTPRMFSNAM